MVAKLIENPAFRDRASVFVDRFDAGRFLADALQDYAEKDVVVLAVPAGGVPIGFTVAARLGVALDVVVVRKVQIPWSTEAGFGAVAWDGRVVLDESLVKWLGLSEEDVEEAVAATKRNVQERLRKFRGGKELPILADKTVIFIDDGLASGFTMLVAVRSVRECKPKRVVVAVPTASLGAIELLTPEADEIVCLNVRSGPSFAVADAYKKWYDLSDDEVLTLLSGASACP